MISRFRIKLVGWICFGITAILFLLAILTTQPTPQENSLKSQWNQIATQISPKLNEIQALNNAQNVDSNTLALQLYDSISPQMARQDSIKRQEGELLAQRQTAIGFCAIFGVAFGMFWLPAFLYLFIVRPKPKINNVANQDM
jgi:hypothetical protein